LRFAIVDGLTDISTLVTVKGAEAVPVPLLAGTVVIGVVGVITAVPATVVAAPVVVPGAVPHAAKMLAMITATSALPNNNRVCLCIKFSHLSLHTDGIPP
jgi:hypothetical protein